MLLLNERKYHLGLKVLDYLRQESCVFSHLVCVYVQDIP